MDELTTARLTSLVVDADDPGRLARFWGLALRWGVDGTALVPDDGTRFDLRFRPATTPKTGKNPIHLDLTSTSPEDQRESVRTLIEAGARLADIGQRPDEPHVVLADPEGNEFCVIEPGNSFLAGRGRLGSITCDGSPRTGRFWGAALGWDLFWDQDEETAVRAPDGAGPFVTWGPPVPPTPASRLHLHLTAADPGRLVALGATRLAPARFADPDGVEFTLATP